MTKSSFLKKMFVARPRLLPERRVLYLESLEERRLLSISPGLTGPVPGEALVPPCDNDRTTENIAGSTETFPPIIINLPERPLLATNSETVTLTNIVTQLTTTEAVVGTTIADVTLAGFGSTITWSFTVDGTASTDFQVVTNTSSGLELQLAAPLTAGTYANIIVTADDGTVTGSAAPFTLNVVTPSLTLSNTVTQLNDYEAIAGAILANVSTNLAGTLTWSYTIDGTVSTDFAVDNSTLSLANELPAGTYNNIIATVTNGTDTVSASPFTLTVVDTSQGDPTWDVSGLAAYTSYYLDASTGGTYYSASLYGVAPDGSQTLIGTAENIGANAVATITGKPYTAENLTVSNGAMTNLGQINFNGGVAKLDTVTIDGSENSDAFTIDSQSLTSSNPVYASNPFTNILNHYATIFGTQSQIYLNISQALNAAWVRLSQYTVTTTSPTDTVALQNGATVNMAGTSQVNINAAGADDTFFINGLGTNYSLSGGTYTSGDTLDFSNAPRVSIDMGATYRQYAVPGGAGTIQLTGDIENVIGSSNADRIVGNSSGTNINGNGGSDVIILTGGTENNVTLTGRGQSVVLRGSGSYNIALTNADYSVVNAAATAPGATVFLTGSGQNITYIGGPGTEVVTITGNNAVVNTGSGDDTITATGNNTTILAGSGNDSITLGGGSNNRVFGEAGNDYIMAAASTGTNFLNAGIGNDIIIGGSGDDFLYGITGINILVGQTGTDRIFGGSDRDLLAASTTSNMSNLTTQADWLALQALWLANNTTETINTLGDASISDGVRDWLFRGAGYGNLFYANPVPDNDFDNALEFSPFNDIFID